MVDAKDEVIAHEIAGARHQFSTSRPPHAECCRDLPLYLLRRGGGERMNRQPCTILPRWEQPGNPQEIGTEIMSPGRDTMGLINHQLDER